MNTITLYTSFFLRDPLVVMALVGTTALLTLALRPRNSRTSLDRLTTLATAASIALILAFTCLPATGTLADLNPALWDPSRITTELSTASGWGSWRYGTDGPLNVLLYAPAGLACSARAHTWPRRLLTLPLLLTLSLVIECFQALTGTRTGSLNDVASNAIGAALGIAAFIAVRFTVRITRRSRHVLIDTERARRQLERGLPLR